MERRNAQPDVHKDERLVVGEPASAAPVRFRSRIDCIPPRARTFDVSARTADVFAGGFRAGCAPSSFCKPLFSSIAGGTNSLMRRSVCSAEATVTVRCRSPSIASARGVNEVITPVARGFPDVQVLDPTPILCPKDTCPARATGSAPIPTTCIISKAMSLPMVKFVPPYLRWLKAPRQSGLRSEVSR
jgi:hypothetical protein